MGSHLDTETVLANAFYFFWLVDSFWHDFVMFCILRSELLDGFLPAQE
jgi:hypothetical protein